MAHRVVMITFLSSSSRWPAIRMNGGDESYEDVYNILRAHADVNTFRFLMNIETCTADKVSKCWRCSRLNEAEKRT